MKAISEITVNTFFSTSLPTTTRNVNFEAARRL